MKVGILGYGKEGKSAEQYFKQHDTETQVFDQFSDTDLDQINFSEFDLVLRSPSVHPRPEFSSMTRYFFDHCPCKIIGITGTKGKGTTSSLITAILKRLHENVFLVGNIGAPAIDVLDQLNPSDVIVYEMSSFQLWDLEKSPHIAVILGIEPDHLNVHKDYHEYIYAKGNITKYQASTDYCIFNQNNPDSTELSKLGKAQTLPYPTKDKSTQLDTLLSRLNIPGKHNQENAEAALLAVAAYYNMSLDELLEQHFDELVNVFQNFEGLPHRLQYLRTLNNVKYYDDNFATNPPSTKVALDAFPSTTKILIAGGRDKTDYQDLSELVQILQTTPHLAKVILIGESGRELMKLLPAEFYQYADTLKSAVNFARQIAEQVAKTEPSIVLMSPAAASFDMFKNAYDRGDKFQKIVQELE